MCPGAPWPLLGPLGPFGPLGPLGPRVPQRPKADFWAGGAQPLQRPLGGWPIALCGACLLHQGDPFAQGPPFCPWRNTSAPRAAPLPQVHHLCPRSKPFATSAAPLLPGSTPLLLVAGGIRPPRSLVPGVPGVEHLGPTFGVLGLPQERRDCPRALVLGFGVAPRLWGCPFGLAQGKGLPQRFWALGPF